MYLPIYLSIYVNFAYYLLLLIFGTELDHVTPDILQSTNVKGQRSQCDITYQQ